MLTSALNTLFKDSKFKKYSFKKLVISISNELITRISKKTYFFKSLKSAPKGTR